MARDPRYDILFEPVKIGPVTAKNRFFQVPHCNGMGHAHAAAHAAHARDEGRGRLGRGLHRGDARSIPRGDITPFVEARLWDDRDIPALALHGRGGARAWRAGRRSS